MSASLAVAVVAILVLGGLLVAGGDATKSDKSDADQVAIYRQLMTLFTLDQARFEVQPANETGWAAKMRRTLGPRVGKRLIAVAVPMRNLGRTVLRPRSMGYRIVTPAGLVIGPEFLETTFGSLDSQDRLAKGKLTSVHLGFRIPNGTRDLTVAFEAGGIRKPAVRTLLGGEG